jgi:hypothetical protein
MHAAVWNCDIAPKRRKKSRITKRMQQPSACQLLTSFLSQFALFIIPFALHASHLGTMLLCLLPNSDEADGILRAHKEPANYQLMPDWHFGINLLSWGFITALLIMCTGGRLFMQHAFRVKLSTLGMGSIALEKFQLAQKCLVPDSRFTLMLARYTRWEEMRLTYFEKLTLMLQDLKKNYF